MAPTASGAWSDMRLRRRDDDTAPLSPWADDWVTATERRLLGDEDAARLAHERRRDAGRYRPRSVIDFEAYVSDERPTVDVANRDDEVAVAILAGRRALLADRPMPFKKETIR